MVLRIDPANEGGRNVLLISGHLRADALIELASEIANAGSDVTLDLQGLSLVDVAGVRFLGLCEKNGAILLNCAPFIREWITRELKTPGLNPL